VLSRDHKAILEKERVEKAGGFIHAGRVNGVLAISRTLGDREFKDPRILALMEVRCE
jgi:serine/threonine protein phosphatase PrpC